MHFLLAYIYYDFEIRNVFVLMMDYFMFDLLFK
jgi:hypothetical protein